jgi:predicted nucleic acid-binding protein
MTTYYLDASALVKYYIPERGSDWISDLLNDRGLDGNWAQAAVTSLLSNVEGVCALERAVRSGRIDAATGDVARRRLLLDMRHRFRVLGVDSHLVLRAAGLAQLYPLRAYDAVHLAAALTLTDNLAQRRLPACVLVSADEDLLSAAHDERLVIANPNDYPAAA